MLETLPDAVLLLQEDTELKSADYFKENLMVTYNNKAATAYFGKDSVKT
jgi:hypothetical protein